MSFLSMSFLITPGGGYDNKLISQIRISLRLTPWSETISGN